MKSKTSASTSCSAKPDLSITAVGLSKVQFIARLNDFYFQFQKFGNNYNQIVKAINAHFSNVAIPHQIAMLEQRTRELKALSLEILNLAKQAKERLRI